MVLVSHGCNLLCFKVNFKVNMKLKFKYLFQEMVVFYVVRVLCKADIHSKQLRLSFNDMF
jgi:hypothetical protein